MYRLDNSTKEYLEKFNCILNEMICKMTAANLTKSISHNFIVQMIPHHCAAIEMSTNILKYTNNPTLQNIATSIISEQTESIKNMKNILRSCSTLNNSRQNICKYQLKMNEIMQRMFFEMKNADVSNNINCDFMNQMIPHHCGAIEMSENTLKYNICSELIPILQAIISSQKRGVEQMQQLLKELNCC